MLRLLRVRNVAIIDDVEVEPGPGLNVVTGETGAGKSVLVGALKLVLGARGRADLVRTGAAAAEVEALFELGQDPRWAARLAQLGLPPDPELVLRRVVGANGRSRAEINGRLATTAQLARLAHGIIDISSQHEHHTLTDPGTHLLHLDAYGGLDARRAAVSEAWQALVQASQALDEARERWARRNERHDLLRYQLAEVEQVDPRPGELLALEAALDRARHTEQLRAAVDAAESGLYAADGAACEQLARAGARLDEAARHDAALRELAERVHAARLDLEEVARDLSRYLGSCTHDERELARLEARHTAVARLVHKHGRDLDALLAWRASAREELDMFDQGEGLIEAREAASRQALDAAAALARALSRARRSTADALGQAITAELGQLGMGGARVQVDVAPNDGPASHLVDGARLGASGLDRVEFLIAPNPGEDPRPLRRVASGGELSRALLALKCVLAGQSPVGLYVFDEVDAGVGGAVAEIIGRKLARVARSHQVLCITHLPQVAAFADVHLRVAKVVRDGRTFSTIERLRDGACRDEVARMLGGIAVTPATRLAAGELLDAARG